MEVKSKEYEAMLLFQPQTAEEVFAEINAKVEELVGQYDGKLHRVDKWNKRFLAYPVKKFGEGIYVIYRFRAPGVVVPELDYVFKYNADVLRYIITDYTERVEKAARRKARRQKGVEK